MNARWVMRGGAVAATLTMIAAGGVAPTVAPASAAAGRTGPAVTQHYTGTRGVARLVPRSARPATEAPARAFPKGARRLPSGRFSATEAAPRALVAAGAATPAPSPVVTFNAASSRDSELTHYNLQFHPPAPGTRQRRG